MTNQDVPKVKVVQVKPTWLERFAQWAGITSHSAFVGWTAKMLGAYVTITMVYEKRVEQALIGIIIALLGELLMATIRRLDSLCDNHNGDMLSVLDTLKQSVAALQPTKASVKVEAKLTINGQELASARSGEPAVVTITEIDQPQNQDNPVAAPQ